MLYISRNAVKNTPNDADLGGNLRNYLHDLMESVKNVPNDAELGAILREKYNSQQSI